ncbi:MAG: hypothetical protein ACI841_004764 [Planctomycetota bacterium]|jgi:hypothetical protein
MQLTFMSAMARWTILSAFFSAALAVVPAAQVELARISPSGSAPADKDGWSVSIDGERMLLGNRLEDPGGIQNQGSATVFDRIGGVWLETATLVATDGAAFDEFGWDVWIDGDLAIVTAPEDDDSGFGSGSVYVFQFDGSAWVEGPKLAPSIHGFGDVFGVTVSLDDDRLAVGACQLTAASTLGIGTGRVFIFELQGGVFVETAVLTASNARDGALFGNGVYLEGDTLLVTAEAGGDVVANGGSAYWFELESSVWTEKQEFRPSSSEAGDFFGRRGGREGDRFVAGASLRDVDGVPDVGIAFVFERDAVSGLWAEEQILTINGTSSSNFGLDCALQGDLIAVGAPGPYGGTQVTGETLLFDAAAGYAEVSRFSSSSAAGGDYFGHYLLFEGSSLLISAPGDQLGGAVFTFDVSTAFADVRDAGQNPSSLRSDNPVLGQTIALTVDLSSSGHALAGIVGFLSPLTLPLGGGQVLLVNPFDPAGEILGLPLTPGPQAQFSIALPADINFLGLSLSAQALHVGAVSPIALSNALDFTVGAL